MNKAGLGVRVRVSVADNYKLRTARTIPPLYRPRKRCAVPLDQRIEPVNFVEAGEQSPNDKLMFGRWL
jgi:hypothetical protein